MGRSEGEVKREILKMLLSVLLALQILHDNSLVHSDVTPDNILVSKGSYYLVDLGLCLREGEKSEYRHFGKSSSFHQLKYVAPEQHSHNVACKASDLYALGKIVLEIVSNCSTIMSSLST